MIIAYARTSTADQVAGLEAQIRDLKAFGAEEVFSEQVSSVAQRDKLDEALRFVRRGDTLVVTKIDRLARSVSDLLRIIDDLIKREIGLVILSMGGQTVDVTSPTGRLMVTMLGAVAQFERELMLERQREGIAKARQNNKFLGRVPTARRKSDLVLEMAANGESRQAIADKLNIGVASVYRILADARKAA